MDRDEASNPETSMRLEQALEPSEEGPRWIRQRALLTRLESCPALTAPPPIVGLLASADERLNLDTLTSILTSDPGVVERLIKLANSTLFDRRRTSVNIRQVFTCMGLTGAVNMALALSLVDVYRHESNRVLLWRRHWLRSLAAGVAAHTLASHLTREHAETAFLAAFTQDIGMIVLACAAPELYEAVDANYLLDRDWAREAELDWYRAHHGEVSAWLLGHWGFPYALQHAAANASRIAGCGPEAAAEIDTLTRCVALSGALADTWIGLETNMPGISRRAAVMARNLFGLMPAQIGPVLSTVSALMPDVSAVFGLSHGRGAPSTKLSKGTILSIRYPGPANPSTEAESSADAEAESTEAIVANEFERSCRHGWPLSVARIRIDMVEGTGQLEAARRVVVRTVRPSDIVSVNGDDELVVAMPGTGAEGATAGARRLVKAFLSRDVAELGVRCAIGIAAQQEQHYHTSPAAMMEAAQSAANLAQVHGWNHFILADPPADERSETRDSESATEPAPLRQSS